MTAAAPKPKAGSLREWRFESDDTFSDDLGTLGCWVGPRTGPYARTQNDMEAWVLRRYLVAARKAGRLEFPFTLTAPEDDKSWPDFVMDRSGELIGLEVTEAGAKRHQQWMTEFDKTAGPDSISFIGGEEADGLPSDSDTAGQVILAHDRKLAKLNGGHYSAAAHCELLIYDNTATGPFLDNGELAGLVSGSICGRQETPEKRFSAVHLIGGGAVDFGILGNPETIEIHDEYDIDFAGWVQGQVKKLAANDTGGLDVRNLMEELETLGRSEFKKIRSQAQRLIMHLLKWEFQPERRTRSWKVTMNTARREIFDDVSDSLSFKKKLQDKDEWAKTYAWARQDAADETGLAKSAFPETCPYTYEQVMDGEFFPGPPWENEGA